MGELKAKQLYEMEKTEILKQIGELLFRQGYIEIGEKKRFDEAVAARAMGGERLG